MEGCWQYMINNKGKTLFEVLIFVIAFVVVASVILILILHGIENENFRTLKTSITNLTTSNTLYQMEISDNSTVSLKELIDEKIVKEITNPFKRKETCDIYESRVALNGEDTTATLKCGEYLITMNSNDKKAIVYKVGKWQDEKTENAETKVGYNYIVDGNLQLKGYYEDYMFLYLFNKEHGTFYETIEEIPTEYNVVNHISYRSKEKMKEI